MSMELGRPIRRVPRKRDQNGVSRTPARELEGMTPDQQCYFLYCRGYSSPKIGEMLGIDHKTAMRRVKKVAAERRPTDEDRLNWVQESVDSLAQVKSAAWEHFEESGDPYLLAQITAAEERIARVRGLMNNNPLVETDGNVSIIITRSNQTSRVTEQGNSVSA